MTVHLLKGPFTVDAYQRLGELGVLGHDGHVELIDGQIVEMTPIGPAHAGCVTILNNRLAPLVGTRGLVSVQNPLRLTERSEPQSDIVVLRPRADEYRSAHPEAADVLVAVEVADTSLAYDRDVKLPLYAAAGIPEVWLVDLPGAAVLVYRDPGPQGYAAVSTAKRGDSVSMQRLPDVTLRVDEILG